jgi:alanine dehydrogenase
MADDPHLQAGLNVCEGHVTHEAVAKALGQPYVRAAEVIG